jgi:hypothetical protein
MKGGFETGIVILFAMMFLWMGISMVQVMWAYNQARFYQEYVLTTIERQNRYDTEVHTLILQDAPACDACVLEITPDILDNSRMSISIRFPVRISVFGVDASVKIKATTRPLS